jgi:hypothetical protein
MRTSILFLFISLLSAPLILSGQYDYEPDYITLPKHYISVNPLNMWLFQQIGITYEYKPGAVGYGIYTGYIYPNKKDYSNYFIAGPTLYGSLGDYSGIFIEPQLNVYLTKPRNTDQTGQVYLAFKGVYKYMHIDSAIHTAWINEGDGYYIYRKMNDKVNIFGAFVDFGFKYYFHHFFFDINIGPGMMFVNHQMTISGESMGSNSNYVHPVNPPRYEELHQKSWTINFTLTLGGAF